MIHHHGTRSIDERIDWILDLSQQHSQVFCSPEAQLARKLYQAKHNTMVIVLKCMDGRIHIPYATQTPLGIITPMRNLGGMFDLGWPYLGEVLFNSVNDAVSAGKKVLILITYHYSKGSRERGCAGFHYDCDAAMEHTYQIRQQVEAIFGSAHQTVYPMVCGFETDEDALIFHGDEERTLNMATISQADEEGLYGAIRALCPDMPVQITRDLLPLAMGNIRHIAQMRQTKRELNIDHQEWMICVGRGFDFLHVPNVALIVGPYSPDLSGPIAKAASIIEANMREGRIRDDGFFLLASAPYREVGMDRARAELKSRFLSDFAARVIAESLPQLYPKMIRKTAILNWQTRALEIIQHHGNAQEGAREGKWSE
ncbi:hypothetical protein Selin_1106 [Desulfurispirillum indicum S5]|uniref:Carboxysome Shell Carbonic Anhydrase n=1 Tax=Desulfurispirillum indicum (strain ATCC BAA-1389 / DSM 22839 / S5) TaxID=653733 RepID=E6W3X3_DESIS|nr:carboxysome shell carbonic anhydrase domain-containg protein [Desulfurispirillum indicum]ADU65841.1 hypothetical protein Selin_1106 [Desulfurispirillum indicum S5]